MIAEGMLAKVLYLFRGKGAGHLGRVAEDKGALGEGLAGRDQGPCCHQAVIGDDSPVQDDRPHADEGVVADFAGVEDGPVADRDVIADDGRGVVVHVDDTVILDVGILADDDVGDIGPEHGVKPDAGPLLDDDAADENCFISDK